MLRLLIFYMIDSLASPSSSETAFTLVIFHTYIAMTESIGQSSTLGFTFIQDWLRRIKSI